MRELNEKQLAQMKVYCLKTEDSVRMYEAADGLDYMILFLYLEMAEATCLQPKYQDCHPCYVPPKLLREIIASEQEKGMGGVLLAESYWSGSLCRVNYTD